jgi:hypothetical protein
MMVLSDSAPRRPAAAAVVQAVARAAFGLTLFVGRR